MVRLAGFEPATFGSGDRRSNPTELQAHKVFLRTCRCPSYHASLRGVQSGTAVPEGPSSKSLNQRGPRIDIADRVAAGGYWVVTVTLPRAASVSELLITDPFERIATRSDPGFSFLAKNVDTVVPLT